MAHSSLQTAPEPGQLYYLDTSALLVIMVPAAVKARDKVESRDVQRYHDVEPFLKSVLSKGGRISTSVLGFEEVAHRAHRNSRERHAREAGFSGWNDLKHDQVRKLQVNTLAQEDVLKTLQVCASSLASVGGQVEQPPVAPGDKAVVGRRLRKAQREFIRLYSGLDPMDALHLALGMELGAKHFVSFDVAWRAVSQVTVHA